MKTSKQQIYPITAESVTEGHPDKVADQISDAILDACLEQDPLSRVACETLVTKDNIVLAGEITTKAKVDYEAVARAAVRRVGYDRSDLGFWADTCEVMVLIQQQTADIDRGVRLGGAGDQGTVFGYATSESPGFIPMPLYLSHQLTRRLAQVRKDGTLPWLRPDGKAQVTLETVEVWQPKRIATVVLSAQHDPDVTYSELREGLIEEVILKVLPFNLVDNRMKVHINPTGRFVEGGPAADTGLTGRKIVVDTYGGVVPHGGGAFSGKDPTKVDRSAAYMARLIARHFVEIGFAQRAMVSLSYAIGVPEPVAVYLYTFGTGGGDSPVALEEHIRSSWPLNPQGIIEYLDLRRPIYTPTAAYGHFGRLDVRFNWEKSGPKSLYREGDYDA